MRFSVDSYQQQNIRAVDTCVEGTILEQLGLSCYFFLFKGLGVVRIFENIDFFLHLLKY